jgi:preprotein translocase SecF subunit
MKIKLIPAETKIDFIGKKYIAFVLSAILIATTVIAVATRGLNYGIDFTGGILIEAEFEGLVDLADMRTVLKQANIGDISLQTFGEQNNILIRVGHSSENSDQRLTYINKIKQVIGDNFSGNVDYRKVDYVGPKVGSELVKSGVISVLIALVAIMLYVWFRFEWQYGVGAIAALFHDAILMIGFFSVTQLEFNLSSFAAILTVIGYSINDSVVIFDRIRENMRKYKKLTMSVLLNLSVNDTLSRTIVTSLTTVLPLISLVIFGGEIIKSFSLAALFGIIIGTYSSIYISAPILIYMNLRPEKLAS